jgi:hypothetical protein
MNRTLEARGLRTRWVGLLPLVVLLLALAAGILHHHACDDGCRTCAVCSLGQVAAVATVAVIGVAPVVRPERLQLLPVATPVAARISSPSGRSPPSL